MDYANIAEIAEWSRSVRQREPDFIIGEPERPYLRRWWIIPRNEFQNVYLHEILRSDDDRALHDHPWENRSILIEGRYVEHTLAGSFLRQPGSVIARNATDAHRLEITSSGHAVSLFFTGQKVREWGFLCPQGWRHWRDFTGGVNGEIVGRGCGE